MGVPEGSDKSRSLEGRRRLSFSDWLWWRMRLPGQAAPAPAPCESQPHSWAVSGSQKASSPGPLWRLAQGPGGVPPPQGAAWSCPAVLPVLVFLDDSDAGSGLATLEVLFSLPEKKSHPGRQSTTAPAGHTAGLHCFFLSLFRDCYLFNFYNVYLHGSEAQSIKQSI